MGFRILVLGGGSIGRRHADNLRAEGVEATVADPDPHRRPAAGDGIGWAWPVNGPAELRGYDGVIVATPSRFHAEHALWAVEAGLPVMVEKPLAVDLDSARSLVVAAGRHQAMVAYNLRYHAPVQRAMDSVLSGRIGSVVAARVWFGSYLPDWRPGVDYRRTYSAQRDLGGGILRDASHELDLVNWAFADPIEVRHATMDNSGQLEIDVEDMVTASLVAGDVPVEVSLDYLSRDYQRGMEFTGSEGRINLDWSRRLLEIETADGVHAVKGLDWDVSKSYQHEVRAFLDLIRSGRGPVTGLAEGLRAVELAARIEEAAGWT